MEIIPSSPFNFLLEMEMSTVKNYHLIQLLLLLIDNACLFINILKLPFTSKNLIF